MGRSYELPRCCCRLQEAGLRQGFGAAARLSLAGGCWEYDRLQDWEVTGAWGMVLPSIPASIVGESELLSRRSAGSSASLALVALLYLRMYTSACLVPLCAALFAASSESKVVARYALHVVAASASSSEPPSVDALLPGRPPPASSTDAAPRFLQVLLTVTFFMSDKASSCGCSVCRPLLLQLVTVVVLLLQLSKPDSVSLKSAKALSEDRRLLPAPLRWWDARQLLLMLLVVLVSTLGPPWSLDLVGKSLRSSSPQSWSWHVLSAISLLGMEISYGTETRWSLLGPMRMLLVEVWRSFTGRGSLDTLLLRLLVLEELGSLG